MRYKLKLKLLEIIKFWTVIICLGITTRVICILLRLFEWAVEKLDELLDNLIEKDIKRLEDGGLNDE